MSFALKHPLNSLAARLVQDNLLTASAAQVAIAQSNADHISFISYVVQQKKIPSIQLAMAIAQDFGLPLLDIDEFESTALPNIVSKKLIFKHHMLPLMLKGKILYLAVADPTNQTALDEIKFHAGFSVCCIMVEEDKLSRLIEKIVTTEETETLDGLTESALDELSIASNEKNATQLQTNVIEQDAPIVRYVNKILVDAIQNGASDIHFEPYEKSYRIRNRLDGVLYQIANPPSDLSNRITARIKILAQLNISERRIPQDGRFKMLLSKKRSIDFRVSTCPTINGEKIVVRILDPSTASLKIDLLGFELWQQNIFTQAIAKPQGMILVTGPTGSGKTITLYTALSILNTHEINISTVEDPVEIYLQGINQVNINSKTGLTFSTVMRAFLRQDPDIIMVGEMRDLETAEIGIKAAQTGHLVLSTLHTNSASETLTRLANMGIPGYNIATSVSLIMAQRLARKLCEHCKKELKIPKTELMNEGFSKNEMDELKIYEPVGCKYCTQGYNGRTGIFELLSITGSIGDVIMRGGASLEIAKQAREEGMQTLRDSGLNKVREGLTSLAEINRVTKD